MDGEIPNFLDASYLLCCNSVHRNVVCHHTTFFSVEDLHVGVYIYIYIYIYMLRPDSQPPARFKAGWPASKLAARFIANVKTVCCETYHGESGVFRDMVPTSKSFMV